MQLDKIIQKFIKYVNMLEVFVLLMFFALACLYAKNVVASFDVDVNEENAREWLTMLVGLTDMRR